MNKIIINVILPMLLCIVGYILYGQNLVVIKWLDCMSFYSLKEFILDAGTKSIFPSLVMNYIPDMIWAYALAYLLFALWRTDLSISYLTIVLVVIAVITPEFGQLLEIIPGTFCYIDLVLSIFAVIIAYIAVNYKKNNLEES